MHFSAALGPETTNIGYWDPLGNKVDIGATSGVDGSTEGWDLRWDLDPGASKTARWIYLAFTNPGSPIWLN